MPFAIDDGTGRALVDPRGAVIALASFAEGTAFAPQGGMREDVLAPGDRVEVCGLAVREPDPDAAGRETGYREMPTRLRLAASRRYALLISATP